jgi:hypothetical protein
MLEQKKIAIDKMNAMYVTHAALPLSAVGNTVMQACIPK